MLLSLGFRAAFDSLDHAFLFKSLESFQLGEKFLSWASLLYSSSESCVLNGGLSSGWFPFQKGIRQGCPISPFLFALAVEKLADKIRGNNRILGIDLLGTHTKILQFADDSTLFLQNEASLKEALQVLDNFKKISGLELNLQKTKGLCLGDLHLESEESEQISWVEQLKILGIHFSNRDDESEDQILNFDPALNKMKRTALSWKLRNLSLKGKVVILNTLILPIIYFQCQMLPVSAAIFREIENIVTVHVPLERQEAKGGSQLSGKTDKSRGTRFTQHP